MISLNFPSKLRQIYLLPVSGQNLSNCCRYKDNLSISRILWIKSFGGFLLFGPSVLRARPNPAKTGRRRALDRVHQRARAGGDMAGMLLFETCKDAASWHASMIMMMITNDFPRFHAIIMINMNGKLGPSSF